MRQGKYTIEGIAVAPPVGYIEEGDSPRASAERELVLFSRAELEATIDNCEVKPLPWVTAFALALRHKGDAKTVAI